MVKVNTLASKLMVASVAVAMLFTVATPAQAQTVEELQAQITALMAQVAALSGGSSSASAACTFTGSLTLGAQGASVTCLQNYLISAGYSIPAGATGYFGAQTQSAVAAWQAANGITPAAGYFGPLSQAKFASMTAGAGAGEEEGAAGDLEGGAGSITLDDTAEFSNEEVGEGDEDVEVMAFNVEADDNSDVEVTAIKVEFYQATTADSQDLDDYAESVSVWFDGDMVGESDAEDFSESSNYWTETIDLDEVVIKAGEDADLTIAVTALNSLDTSDIDTDDWSVDLLSVRFKDGEGVTTTESADTAATDGSGTYEKDFDFATFASSADLELKVSNGDDDINDARILDVDATNATDDVELLSFMIEAEGDSDILIKDLPVVLTTTEAAGSSFDEPGDVITSLTLVMDGDEVGSESLSGAASGTADSQTVTFNDIDVTVDAGDEVEFVIVADVVALSGALDEGDTISADITSTERALIDAEDESGEDISTSDMTGTATGDAHTVYDAMVTFELVSTSAAITTTGDAAASPATSDIGTYTIKFDLTAFGGDVWVDKSCSEDDSQGDSGEGLSYIITNGGSNGVSCSVSSTADTDTSSWIVDEGQTETFTLTVAATASADHFAKVYLEAINWDSSATATPTQFFTAGLGEDKTSTDEIFLNDN